VALVLLGVLGVGCSVAPVLDQVDPSCAWSVSLVGAELDEDDPANTVFPDTSASYWISQVPLDASTEVVLRGRTSGVRYWSVQTYVPSDGFTSSIGGVNDAQVRTEPDGSWTIRVSATGGDAGSSDPNHLRGLPEGQTSGTTWIMLRTYLPDDPTLPAGATELPSMEVLTPAASRTVPPCHPFGPATPVQRTPVATEGSVPDWFGAGPLAFRRTNNVTTPFPNVDNAYLAAVAFRAEGRALVVRGRAATFPGDTTGATTDTAQLRFWSFCQFGLPSTSTVECVADEDVPLDDDGWYTIVVSDPADRPTNATAADGVAWLPWGREVTASLGLRNMIPAADFDRSAFEVPTGQSPTVATMSDYAPRATTCDTDVFEAGGAAACGLP
jgi:hypothetical protein